MERASSAPAGETFFHLFLGGKEAFTGKDCPMCCCKRPQKKKTTKHPESFWKLFFFSMFCFQELVLSG